MCYFFFVIIVTIICSVCVHAMSTRQAADVQSASVTIRSFRTYFSSIFSIEDKDIPNYPPKKMKGINEKVIQENDTIISNRKRFLASLPQLDELDKAILRTAIPNMVNLGIIPIVNSINIFFVGRLGIALALAGQTAANQASATLLFLISFLPNIMAPLVASAFASNNLPEARKKVSEILFLSNVFGALGTLLLVAFPKQILSVLVLPGDAPAMKFAVPYLRWRALGIIPSLISATGFAAYRGMLNTVTPLKVSLITSVANLVMNPLCMFTGGMGFVGVAVATAFSEVVGGITTLKLLFRRQLTKWSLLLRPPSVKSLVPLLHGGSAMLFRQLAINLGFLVATRRAQSMDPTGVTGAAYGIVMQIYTVGISLSYAMQNTAASLVPAKLAKSGTACARKCADRLFMWSLLIGVLLGLTQYLSLEILIPLFSTLPEVQKAVRVPSLITSAIHVLNGPVFAMEGVMMGLGSYKHLAIITGIWIAGMILSLMSPLGQRLDGIMWSILLSTIMCRLAVVGHYLKIGPLSIKRDNRV